MAAPFSLEDLAKLNAFVEFVASNPAVLNMPQLAFFKKLIEQFGGVVPEGKFEMPTGAKCPFGGGVKSESKFTSDATEEEDEVHEMDAESEESEVELDMEGVIEADNDVEQPMGDSSKTPTEEEIDKSGELRSQAATAYGEQKFQEAIDLYTQAIELNPGNALFHAKRGQAFLKLKKPNACIRDCTKALEINCDSAAAYKFRGRANRLLGKWEDAAKDLRQACKLDYDEETDEWLREVTPNAKKIEQHRLKQQRKISERQRKGEELKREKKTQQKASASSKPESASGETGGLPEDMLGGMNFLDVIMRLNDPETSAAMKEVIENPASIDKYKNDPKLADLVSIFKKFVPGGVPCAESPGFTPPPTSGKANEPKEAPKKPDFADDGLD